MTNTTFNIYFNGDSERGTAIQPRTEGEPDPNDPVRSKGTARQLGELMAIKQAIKSTVNISIGYIGEFTGSQHKQDRINMATSAAKSVGLMIANPMVGSLNLLISTLKAALDVTISESKEIRRTAEARRRAGANFNRSRMV